MYIIYLFILSVFHRYLYITGNSNWLILSIYWYYWYIHITDITDIMIDLLILLLLVICWFCLFTNSDVTHTWFIDDFSGWLLRFPDTSPTDIPSTDTSSKDISTTRDVPDGHFAYYYCLFIYNFIWFWSDNSYKINKKPT